MNDLDAELKAIQAVIDALEPLESEARDRVVHYAFDRLGLDYTGNRPPVGRQERAEPGGGDGGPSRARDDGERKIDDVRTLREQKQPSSANEMAALVGYYLAELAPDSERKSEIGSDDIQRLFKQAGYPLPKRLGMTLPNATAAGYFESTGGGKYRLNPVGHNLVAHNLPRKKSATRTRRASSGRTASKKATSGRTSKTKSNQAPKKKTTRR